ncbi:MAG: hypothetical protein ACRDVG_00295, partial [Jatrophihabitantaceae bacterium]
MQEDELLDPGRTPRWLWTVALALAAALGGYLLLRVLSGHSASAPVAAPTPSASLQSVPTLPGPTSTPPPWPTAPGSCGSDIQLPIVSSTPVRGGTKLVLLVGGAALHRVDFDSGRSTRVPQPPLSRGEYIAQLAAGYALTGNCGGAGARVFRVGTSDHQVALPGRYSTLYADGTRAWAASFTDEQHAYAAITRYG